MIDKKGFRLNVGIVLINDRNEVFLGKRRGQHDAWQFPQGGIKPHETLDEAMYRELEEEVGLKPDDVEVLRRTRNWQIYHLPKRFRRYHIKPLCIGQRQRWFLLKLKSKDEAINLHASGEPEFDEWNWVPFWEPIEKVVSFKRRVYRTVLDEFGTQIFKDEFNAEDANS